MQIVIRIDAEGATPRETLRPTYRRTRATRESSAQALTGGATEPDFNRTPESLRSQHRAGRIPRPFARPLDFMTEILLSVTSAPRAFTDRHIAVTSAAA